MDIIALVTAFGLGSAVTALVQYFLTGYASAKRRTYDERKEAYIGLAEAWMRQEKAGVSSENMLDVGYWILRCELVAPPEMMPVLIRWVDSEAGSPSKKEATHRLKSAMRKDLSNFR